MLALRFSLSMEARRVTSNRKISSRCRTPARWDILIVVGRVVLQPTGLFQYHLQLFFRQQFFGVNDLPRSADGLFARRFYKKYRQAIWVSLS